MASVAHDFHLILGPEHAALTELARPDLATLVSWNSSVSTTSSSARRASRVNVHGATVETSMKKALTPIQEAEQRIAASRELDTELIRRGVISAEELGRRNGAFGLAVGRSGPIDWHRAVRAI